MVVHIFISHNLNVLLLVVDGRKKVLLYEFQMGLYYQPLMSGQYRVLAEENLRILIINRPRCKFLSHRSHRVTCVVNAK